MTSVNRKESQGREAPTSIFKCVYTLENACRLTV